MKQPLVFVFLGFFMASGILLFAPIFTHAADLPVPKCSDPCGTKDSPTKVQAPLSISVVKKDDATQYEFRICKTLTGSCSDALEDSGWISNNFYTTKNIKEKGVYRWMAWMKRGADITPAHSTWYFFEVTKVCPAGSVCIQNPLQTESFTGVVDRILNIIFFVAIAVAPVMILVAGFKFLTGGGDPKNLTSAKQMLIWTGIGFGIILLSKGIVVILRGVIGF